MSQPSTTLPSGSKLPLNGFGTWKAPHAETVAAVEAAIQCGYRHIDCAAIYLNERSVGEALTRCVKTESNPGGIVERDELFITSKVWNTCHERSRVVAACRQTLLDLGLDYLDLYLMHFPYAFEGGEVPVTEENCVPKKDGKIVWAKGVSVLETYRGLEDCVREGLVKNIGISNFSAAALVELMGNCEIRPAVFQSEGHVYNTRSKLRAICKEFGVHFTMYSVLGSGKQGPLQDEVVGEIAEKMKVSRAQILLGWGMCRGSSVLSKSVKEKRIGENFAAGGVVIAEEDLTRLDGLDRGAVVCNMEEYWGFASHV